MRVISELAQPAYPLNRQDAEPLPRPVDNETVYRIFVRDLNVEWNIGVYDHEHRSSQPVQINLELDVQSLADWQADDYHAVPCYDVLSQRIRAMATDGHVKLVETLADRIAALCLDDDRIRRVRVRVEKPEALADAASVGVEIERSRSA